MELNKPPQNLSLVQGIIDIQIKIIELIGQYSNIQIIFENFTILIREISSFFDEYFAHHSNKPYVSTYIQCIVIYFLEQIQLPFEVFLSTMTPQFLAKDQLTTLHIKLLVFVG
jgi:hypothetical protein